MALTLCVLLTAVPGNESLLVEYEDQAIKLFDAHGARLLQRVRAVDAQDGPLEVHLLEFPSEEAWEQYMQDPARLALADLRSRAIADTQIMRVEIVSPLRPPNG